MESVESNNFYNLGTTLTTGHLAKLHLAVSQSLLAQELMGCAWNQTTGTTYRQLALKLLFQLTRVTQLTQLTQVTQVTQGLPRLGCYHVALDSAILPPPPSTLEGEVTRESVESVGQFCDFFVATCQGALVLGCTGQS